MEYTKIRISSKDAPSRLYRILLVSEDLPLPVFAEVLMILFEMSDEHMYKFVSGGRQFVIGYGEEGREDWLPMADYKISDLAPKSNFVYDFGEWWEFDIVKHKRPVSRDLTNPVVLTGGEGQGIFEDDRASFLAYINGSVNGRSRNTDPSRGPSLPWNLELKRFGDFDRPIDIAFLQEDIDDVTGDMNEEWIRFEHLMDAAFEQWDAGDGTGLYLQAFEEFEAVCEKLKAEHRLPETTDELFEDPDIPDAACDLFMEVPSALQEDGEYEKLYEILQRIKQRFTLTGVCKNLWNYHMYHALKGTEREEEAYETADDWFRREADNPFAVSLKIETLADHRKYREAEKLIRDHTREGDEYDMNNSVIFAAAITYYRSRNMVKKAQKLADRIEDARRENEEMMDRLSFPDEDEDYIGEAVEDYMDDPTERNYVRIGEALCAGILNGTFVYPEVEYVDDEGADFRVIEIDKHPFLTIYTCPEAAERRGYKPQAQVPLSMLKKITEDMDVEGILVNPDFERQLCIIPLELIHQLIDALHADEGEDDDRIPALLN